MTDPRDECLDLGHDLAPMGDRPEVEQCSRCGCVFQNSGGTLTLLINDRIVAIPNAVCIIP